MFVKLTKIDGSPVWINASFVVTVEPSRGGSVVVPVGDGLDYDVREKPEEVLALLDGAPVAAVLPIPAVDALAPTAEDVSPDAPSAKPDAPEAKPKTAKKASARKTASKKKSEESKKEPEAEPEAEPAPKKPPRKKSEDEIQAEFQAAVAGVEESPSKKKRSSKVSEEFVPTLTEDQVSRLRKMMPGKVSTLVNTLSTQFGVAPAYAEATREWLIKEGVMAMVGNRIAWL